MPLPDALEIYLQNPDAATVAELRSNPERYGLSRGGAALVRALRRISDLEARNLSDGLEFIRDLRPSIWYDDTAFESTNAYATQFTKWHDISGNANFATAVSNGSATATLDVANYATGTDGIRRFGAAIGANQHFTFGSAPTLDWCYIVGRISNANDNLSMAMSNGSTQYWGLKQVNPYPQPFAPGGTAAGYGSDMPRGGRLVASHGVPQIYSWRNTPVPYIQGYTPTRYFGMGVNGYERCARGADYAFVPTMMFGYNSTNFDYVGTGFEVIGGNSNINEVDRARIERYLAAKYGITLAAGKRLTLIGDSIGFGYSATGWFDQLLGVMNGASGLLDAGGDTTWNGMNFSVIGHTTQNGLGQNLAYNLAKSTCDRTVFCAHLGTNDLDGGLSVSDTVERLANIGQRARLSGYSETWLLPCLDRSGLATATKNAFNATAETLVGAGRFTKFLDPASIPALCADGASANAANFPDGIHPSTAGHLILATAIRNKMIG